jgi:hypothetical protein
MVTLFGQFQITLLITLNEEFKDSKFINKEIASVLTTKSFKQISDKRRRLGLCNKPQHEQDVNVLSKHADGMLEQDLEQDIELGFSSCFNHTEVMKQPSETFDNPEVVNTSDIFHPLILNSGEIVDPLPDNCCIEPVLMANSFSEPIEDI